MDTFIPTSFTSVSTTSPLTDVVLQTIAALQACPTSSIQSTSTSSILSSPNLTFPPTIPSVNLFPPPTQPQLGVSVQNFLPNTSLLQATPSALDLLTLFATTSRRASCPEPPATSQATVTLQVPSSGSPERRRYSETNVETLIREQLAQMMPSTAQLPGMPGCYYQHVPAVTSSGSVSSGLELQRAMEQTRIQNNLVNAQRRAQNHRKARTIYGTTQTQQLEDMFRGQMYVVGAERENLAARLGLSPSQVRIWFQNRRSKHRRKQQEEQQTKSPGFSEKEEKLDEEEEDEDEDDDDVKILN
ncbi:Protein CBG26055 [Caenorhabditis briggsae]|uniref:Protein CBG26055 n=2 Tax=Caenorhabditis briggsae TaxID=6238 RepID=B6III3_CAEBR|nr:Protein CBG26055 [Caenorhabditis briggsae]ULU02860.1 hypothetical protein L3Y34_002446 [Caenorhabditis briggsae]CAR99713.1 Protein CBG26055 [Caenorhabditis briggsae]